MSTCCGASNCSKKEQCIKYVNNYFECHPNVVAQFIDFSTYGWGVQTDKGFKYRYDCGDLSDGYPYFKEIKKQE